MCTYERYLMTSANLGMSAIDINFHRVVPWPWALKLSLRFVAEGSSRSTLWSLFCTSKTVPEEVLKIPCRLHLTATQVLSMPMIFVLGYFEGFPGTLLDLAARRRTWQNPRKDKRLQGGRHRQTKADKGRQRETKAESWLPSL